jgi:hypothetical protein
MNLKSENVNSWIAFIEASAKLNPRLATRNVFNTILSLMESDAGDVVDDILQHVDPTKLPTTVSLALLAITRTCSSLPSREILRTLIEQHLRANNENVDELLAGL